MAASESRDLSKKKLLSGQHSSTCEEVKGQLYWPHLLLDVCATGSAKRPEYDNLSVQQFAAGFSASILAYLPPQLRGSVVENMLKHLNKIMSYAMVADWSAVLGFNGELLRACENHQLSFADWAPVGRWHERHLQSFQMMKAKNPGKGDQGDNNNDHKDDPNHIPLSYMRAQKLCSKWQAGKCEEGDNHVIGKTTLVHACALCMYKDRGTVVDHAANACPKKFKKKKKGFF
jgi:hypothetical protein